MKLKYSFEIMELDGQEVAVPIGDIVHEFRGVIKLNETAAFMLSLLKDDITEEQIVEVLSKEYGVPNSMIVDDVDKYLNEFRERNLLI